MTEKEKFKKAKKEFIENYIEKKFPGHLKENYGNLVGLFKAGVEMGIEFVKNYHKKGT